MLPSMSEIFAPLRVRKDFGAVCIVGLRGFRERIGELAQAFGSHERRLAQLAHVERAFFDQHPEFGVLNSESGLRLGWSVK